MNYYKYNDNLPKINSNISFLHKGKVIKGTVQYHSSWFCFFVNNNGYYLQDITKLDFLNPFLKSLKHKQLSLSEFRKKSSIDILPKEITELIYIFI